MPQSEHLYHVAAMTIVEVVANTRKVEAPYAERADVGSRWRDVWLSGDELKGSC